MYFGCSYASIITTKGVIMITESTMREGEGSTAVTSTKTARLYEDAVIAHLWHHSLMHLGDGAENEEYVREENDDTHSHWIHVMS